MMFLDPAIFKESKKKKIKFIWFVTLTYTYTHNEKFTRLVWCLGSLNCKPEAH